MFNDTTYMPRFWRSNRPDGTWDGYTPRDMEIIAYMSAVVSDLVTYGEVSQRKLPLALAETAGDHFHGEQVAGPVTSLKRLTELARMCC